MRPAALRRLSKVERLAIKKFIEGLRGFLPGKLESVILFGSKARGSASSTSDTDLAVVLSRAGSPSLRFAVAEAAFEPMAKFGVDISPLIFTSAEFRSPTPLSRSIKKEGITLWSKRRNLLNAA